MPRFLTFSVAAFTLALSGCGADKSSTPAVEDSLQAITVTGASGNLLAQTQLDYRDGQLFRVRSYAARPGIDDIIGTTDDVLGMTGYSNCGISKNGRDLLHDPVTEVYGAYSISSLFQAFSSCATPGLSASSIVSAAYAAGPDGQWMTADDEWLGRYTLSRTAQGSLLRHEWPQPPQDNAACGLHCQGLDDIVYNPYGGVDSETSNSYQYDAAGRVTGLAQGNELIRYELAADGFINARETSSLPDENGHYSYLAREDYVKAGNGNLQARERRLMDSSLFDAVSSSPTGQILLAILGFSTEHVTAIDGTSYVSMGNQYYLIERTGQRIDRVRRLAGAGPDEVWYTGDDVVDASVSFKYGKP